MENLVKKFLQRLDINRWYAKDTIGNYWRNLWHFNYYLVSVGKKWINSPEEITVKDVDNFVEEQKKQWKASCTCNNYLAWIKLYLRRNLIEGKDVEDYRKILTSRCPERKVDALREEEWKRLLNYFKNVKLWRNKEIIKRRNIMICYLLLYTWLRTTELTSLKIEDIAKETQIIGKWGVRRTIYLFEEDLKIINEYLELREDNNPYLIVNHAHNYKPNRLSNSSIDRIIKEWWKACWIRVRPHMLRHTFATNLLRKNAKLPYIQKLLGHKNIATTQTYLTVLDNDLRETSELLRK